MDKLQEPDWSRVDATGYRVVVSPSSYFITCWEFLCLIPAGSETAEDLVLVRQLCEATLDERDKYSIYRMTYDDQESYAVGMPILAFHPDDHERFLWIYPPHHLRH